MAKLSARGRTELFRMVMNIPANAEGTNSGAHTVTYAFMSDGKALRKYKFEGSPSVGWTVSTLSATLTQEQLKQRLLEKGYQVEGLRA